MEFDKVKLIVSDMDGTLLNDAGEVSELFFDLHQKLKALDIKFIAASGRQYYSIIEKLDPIKEDLLVIAENGGFVKKGEINLMTCTLPLAMIKSLIKKIRLIDDAHFVLCGKEQAYVEDKNTDFLNLFKEYYTKYKLVDDVLTIKNDEFFKIAIYSFGGSEDVSYPHFKTYEEELKVKVSGPNWLDLSEKNTDKGSALKFVQEKYGITIEETMAFGDYNNDLEMMENASFSYAMGNAHPNIIEACTYKTKSNEEGGVEFILSQVVEFHENLSPKER